MKIYFMGVCGTAMGNAALLARAAGHEVLGADSGVYPPMSTVLESAGITLHEGYDAARLEKLAPDLVVIGNAMSRGNAEVEWLLDSRRFSFTSLPAMLHEFILKNRRNIVVAGTHGKTTTTSITAFLLRENGVDPGFLIGGVPQDPPTGNHLGSLDAPFVIEGDEYDSAFFDKRSKFIHYAPHIAVLNNLEFDHADIFRDLIDVQRTFNHLTRIVPRNGWVLLNGDDENLRMFSALSWTRVVRIGTSETNEVRIVDFEEDGEGVRFELWWRGSLWGKVQWGLHGLYNVRNAAMAAVAAALAVLPKLAPLSGAPDTVLPASPPSGFTLAPLERFRGVRRRQEILVRRAGLTVMEDFGHHPTALAETMHSLRSRFSGATLTAVYEPRSNTARTKALQTGFTRALALADEVYIGAVNRSEKLAVEERFDAEAVVQHLEAHGVEAQFFASNLVLFEKLSAVTLPRGQKARVVVFFTNGSFDGIIARYAAAAKEQGKA